MEWKCDFVDIGGRPFTERASRVSYFFRAVLRAIFFAGRLLSALFFCIVKKPPADLIANSLPFFKPQRMAKMARSAQPARKRRPPNGVIAPSVVVPVSARA